MSWFNRRLFLSGLLSLAALSGCGFTPVYGPGGSAEGLRGSITPHAPFDTNSYEFVKHVEGRLGRNLSAPYELRYKISTEQKDVAVTPNQEITRAHILGELTFEIVARENDSSDEAIVYKGHLSNFTSYSTAGSTVSTASVERDAYRRLMVSLADMMVTDLSISFAGWDK